MPMYEYENGKGERREILASMKSPPPELVQFRVDGTWIGLGTFDGHPMPRNLAGEGEQPLELYHGQPVVWGRVYGAGLRVSIPNFGITYDRIPASRSLPRRRGGKLDKLHGHTVMRHTDGGYTTTDGRPIIQGKADALREQGRTGYKRA